MAFWGHSFVFNGIPCEDFDLMVYDVGSSTQSQGEFASGVTVVEDRVPSRWKPYFYGTTMDGKLSFKLVFGVNEERIDSGRYLDRTEMERIASWLTGHSAYKWLSINQDDMRGIRYKCVVKTLKMVEYGSVPWAFEAEIECDSPYAYRYPQEFSYEIGSGETDLCIFNESSHNGYLYPELVFNLGETKPTYISITNQTDGNREFKLGSALKPIPSTSGDITFDNDRQIISCTGDLNLYDYFNFNFFRLSRWHNDIRVQTDAAFTLNMTCVFPVNVGA